MPTYVYRREDGTTFEKQQSIKDDALETCPETGQPAERIITGSPGLILDSTSISSPDRSGGHSPGGCCGPMCDL